jgi:uncharacterized membrane protein
VATLTVNAGTYTLTLSKTGYVALSQSITVSASTSLSRSLTQTPSVPPPPTPTQNPTQYTITIETIRAFHVEDDEEDDDLENAQISGVDVTLNGTTKTTGSDGKTTFAVGPGKYTLHVEKNGYKPVDVNIEVSKDGSISITLKKIWHEDNDYEVESDDSHRHREWHCEEHDD